MTTSEDRFYPLKHPIWHPCSQMKDYEKFPPLRIKSASGSVITTESGKKIIDVISSWWCKSLGHSHPRLRQALIKQSELFEHVLLANTSNKKIEELSHALCELSPNFSKVFYSSDGSSAVEIALKMALQYHKQSQKKSNSPKKNRFAYLSGAYHGENILCLSVSDLDLYSSPFKDHMQKNIKLPQHRLLSGKDDEHWKSHQDFEKAKKILEKNKDSLSALIVEPIVQGAGGMHIYSPTFLSDLAKWCKNNDVLLIADEIMTGFCRTGTWLACEHAKVVPDICCVMKGLSAGVLPISAVITNDKIYKAFYDTYESGKAFMHSNTHSGNALAVAVSLEALKIYREENWAEKVSQRGPLLKQMFKRIGEKTGVLKNIRGLGFIAAADLYYENMPQRAAFHLYQLAIENGLLLRPLGNTIYLFPPFIITDAQLKETEQIIVHCLKILLKSSSS